ncbi:helix-hairpin-helix domain-containing protein [Listeria innocua]|uniref:helix-hairpin-helix domain-containing protein n=1 Tax=Listeria innocua TaxID=1642 RepID=UPI0005EEDF62|nr:helix-hairpin-helix domain-containing protein [Listeria innocua]EAD5703857.1 Mitomycin resistance protein mcrB [Listeria innocua]EAD5752304.1 Mitomycin resistance protein mcrB [Listeria innocua]EAE6208030.1 Mitomycin resistance protein mcrB [Listeria innocua]EAH4449812.1 Mitomycin resistance protein mcrB [Listeria innocua]EDO1203582.1 Mitomycin resistance protein mcrB [Listeria innocua]
MPTDLIKLPGIGKKMVLMLNEIGIEKVADLRGKNPLDLYENTCAKRGERMDPCVLYTYRCAVYVAETDETEQHADLRKWWNWKDKQHTNERNLKDE